MKILVPLDGSALAETAIPMARQLAREHRASISLVRATEAPWLHGQDLGELQVKVMREAEEYLNGVAQQLRAEGCAEVETSIWYGAPALSIVEAARSQRADLIVMTSHGRGGLGRLVFGSVAESVLRGTTTPILLLRPTGATVLPLEGEARRAERAHA